MKKFYEKANTGPVTLELESVLLTGSVTVSTMQVQNVTVEQYNQGFGTDSTDDFQNVSFD